MKLSGLFLFAASMATTPTTVLSQAETCPLSCDHGSTCVLGDADYSQHPTDVNGLPFSFHKNLNREGWHCECDDDWTGLRCARKVEICNDPSATAGTGTGTGTGTQQHYCYHGGKCLDGLDAKVTTENLFCDCTNAQHNNVPYVGKYCEIPGAQTCGDDSSSDVFCTNDGTCVEGFETKTHPCECPAGHRGPHCEFDTGHVPECVLQCQNGGQCMLGIKNYEQAKYSDFWALHDGNFQYCECPDGHFGPTCDVAGASCGDAHCFNGAVCLQSFDVNNQTTYACDCNEANTFEVSFAGDYCQESSTLFCTKGATSNGHLFCTNGGTCKPEEHEGCDCPEGYHGPICEFDDAVAAAAKTCNLECKNNGKCRTGKKDNQLIHKFGDDLSAYTNQTHVGLWEHCVCPDGFFGIQCEHELEICPGGGHVCLHGSKCVPLEETAASSNQDSKTHKCDCDHGFDAVEKYAGKFCQYTSTDICTKNGRPGVGKANFAFCVNNGRCKAKVDDTQPHPGCDCDKGFTGDHCEFLEGNEPNAPKPAQAATPVKKSSLNTTEGLVIALAVALLLLVAVIGSGLLKKAMTGKEDIGKDVAAAPVPEPEVMRSPGQEGEEESVEQGEGTFVGEESVPATDGEMKTVEII